MTLGVVSFGPASRVLPCRCAGACRRCQAATQLDGLGAALPSVPYLLAGSTDVGGVINRWLSDSWSAGAYNNWMRSMNSAFEQWNALGSGDNWNNCWGKYPAQRKAWLDFWSRFSKHYKEHGQVSTLSYLSDSEEAPARDFMREAAVWGAWLNKNCRAKADEKDSPFDNPVPPPDPSQKPTDWGSVAKWSALGIGGIVLLSLAGSVRSVMGR